MATLQRLALRGTPKATKAAARYTPAGGAERCGMCRHYAAPSSCARIEGPVSAAGWCALFSRQVTNPHHAGVQSFGGAPPSLDLDFTTGTIDPRITCARASVASYFDSAGTIQTSPNDTPRIDFDPVTHKGLGLLVEGSRTNFLKNSAVLITQTNTVSAQTYILSFYGSGTIVLSGNAAGTLVGTGPFPARASMTVVVGTTGPVTATVTGTVLNAQMENATFISSWIPTAAANVTRALDDVKMPLDTWFNTARTTMVAKYLVMQSPNPGPAGANRETCGISDGTTANRIVLRGQSGSGSGSVAQGFVAIGGVSQFASVAGTLTGGVPATLGVSWDGTTSFSSFNGSASLPAVSTGMPAGLNVLTFGNGLAALVAPQFGWLQRFRYWPRALGASELQSVTV